MKYTLASWVGTINITILVVSPHSLFWFVCISAVPSWWPALG